MFFLSTIRAWFRERARIVYRFRDGFGRTVRVDPVVIGNRLDEHCPDLGKLLETLDTKLDSAPPGVMRDSLVQQQKDAGLKLAIAARKVFNLLPLSETGVGGVTDGEAISILTHYFVFMEQLAAEAELFPNWPDAGSPSQPASVTASSSASGTGVR